MDHLTDQQLDELKSKLANKMQEIQSLLGVQADNAKPVDLKEPIGRLSRMDAIQQQQMAQDQLRRLNIQKQQIDAALKRIESGDYGICLRTGDPIPFKRLLAMPETPFGSK